jgi:3-oxoacyl-[acyl-carrier-protein] synthase III
MKSPKPLVEIASTGRHLPERILTNAELEKMVDTSDQWIRERTGISARRIAACDVGVAVMGTKAAAIAMERAGVSAGEIDLIVVSTGCCRPRRAISRRSSARRTPPRSTSPLRAPASSTR